MRRAPYVIGGTAAGLALVLSFHTSGSSVVSLATGPTTSTSRPAQAATTTAPSPTAPPTTAAPATTSTTVGTTRSAKGQSVFYRYGILQLRVTITGSRMTTVTTVADQASDPRSAEINSQAIPLLHDQAMQAQSANIDGVSGATYTSEAYQQSLQSALDQLGWKG